MLLFVIILSTILIMSGSVHIFKEITENILTLSNCNFNSQIIGCDTIIIQSSLVPIELLWSEKDFLNGFHSQTIEFSIIKENIIRFNEIIDKIKQLYSNQVSFINFFLLVLLLSTLIKKPYLLICIYLILLNIPKLQAINNPIGLWGTSYSNTQVWKAIATSDSGQYVYATINAQLGGYIYSNNNYGVNESWVISYDITSEYWTSIATDNSGRYVFACASGGNVYMNFDYGGSLAWVTSFGSSLSLQSIATSGFGQYVLLGIYSGSIYVNNNYGNSISWATSYSTIVNVQSVAISDSGKYMFAVITNGHILMNNNYGFSANWTISNAINRFWNSISLSNSGQYVIATVYSIGGFIYLNNNYGTYGSWITSYSNSQWWISITISASGQHMYAVASLNNYVYVNNNYGAIGYWNNTNMGPLSQSWHCIATNNDSQHVYVTASPGYIYSMNLVSSPTSQPT